MGGFIRPKRPEPRPEPVAVAPKPIPKPKPKPLIETTADVKYDDKKRKGRRSTILTSVTGATDELELVKKTLLGGE